MSEKERKIIRMLAQLLKISPESTKNYILGWVEGAAANNLESPVQTLELSEQRPGALGPPVRRGCVRG